MSIIPNILSKLHNVTQSGDGWTACCPAHDDQNPSLSIRQTADGKILLHCFAGCDYGNIVKALQSRGIDFPNTSANRPAPRPKLDARARANIERMGREITDDDGTIAAYLRSRGLSGQVPPALRLHPSLSYWREGRQFGTYPAMVAAVTAPDGETVTYHRTYLERGGAGKADVPAAKKMMPPVRPGATRGAAIRLTEAAGDSLAVAEGIETTLAVHEATGQDAWATISAGGMAAVEIPEHVRTVYVWADHDPDTDGRRGAGQAAADALAARLHADGRTVYVLLPPEPGTDWLDVFAFDGPDALQAALDAAEPWEPPTEADEWGPVQDLPPMRPTAPTLPPEMVPEPVRPWLVDTAERSSVPLEYVAAPAIVALGAAIGRTVAIRPSKYDDYTIVANLWGGIIGRPGTMKSHHVAEATRPLRHLEAQAWERHEMEQTLTDARMSRIDAQIGALKDAMRKAARQNNTTELADLERQIADKSVERDEAAQAARRYITQDATTEKLGEMLAENPRGILLLRDELAGWLRQLDRYGREGDREFYLEAWNGTGGYTFDRIGRGTVRIKSLTLSILGGIQPGKLQSYIEGALAEGAGDDGLLQRFQVLVWPDHMGEWRRVERWPDTEARQKAMQIFERLATFGPEDVGATIEGGDTIPYLRFADDAQELFDLWRDELENRLRSNALAESPAFESHIAKYRSLIPSLALIFHLAEWANRPTGEPAGPVTLGAVQLAAAWGEYLEAHARKVYADELMQDRMAAGQLAKRIEQGHVADGQTLRDIYNNGWRGLGTSERVRLAAETLAGYNWARIERRETGGRPTEILRIHPDLRGGGARD